MLKHSATSTSPASACSAAGSRPRPPPTTSSRPAAPAWRRRSLVANKIALGQIDVGDRRRRRHHLRRADRRQRGPARGAAGRSTARSRADRARQALTRAAPGPDRARDPAQRGAAHRPVDGRARGAHGRRVGRHARGAGRAGRVASHQQPRRRLRARLLRRPGDALPRARARPEPARRTPRVEKLAKLKPVFGGEDGHDDRRQLDAADRRRRRRCCWPARSGRRSAACRCWPTSSTPRPRRSTTCTSGEGLLMAPAYAMPRMLDRNGLDAAGLRPLRDPRGVRRAGALRR